MCRRKDSAVVIPRTFVVAAFLGLFLSQAYAMSTAETNVEHFHKPFGRDYEVEIRERIVDQIERYLLAYTQRVTDARHERWNRDLSSAEAYITSVSANRQRLRTILGAVDERDEVRMEVYGESPAHAGPLAETQAYTVLAVRWPVLGEIVGEGLLLLPRGAVTAGAVVLPDADQNPEVMVGWDETGRVEPLAAALASQGVAVVVPTLINRQARWADQPRELLPVLGWMKQNDRTVPTHISLSNREILWRQAYVMGRHIIGYELQQAWAALDWLRDEFDPALPLGLAGYGEGGLLALYGAALDERVSTTLVSGYFQPREALAREPVERLVWGLLKEFGDAELASLVLPRTLVIEHSDGPEHEAATPLPPRPATGQRDWFQNMALRAGRPGTLTPASFEDVAGEVDRLRRFVHDAAFEPRITFVHDDGNPVPAGSTQALAAFLQGLGAKLNPDDVVLPPAPTHRIDASRRHNRVMDAINRHLLAWGRRVEFNRYRFFQGDLSSPQAWDRSMEPYRQTLYEQVIGRLPDASEPPPLNVRQRQVFEAPTWTGHEVIYDALPGVWGFGVLAVPNDVAQGERRPVVVLQHGYGGMPGSYARDGAYRDLMSRLCERGFVVFAAHLPFSAEEKNGIPVGATIFSFGLPQYEQALRWLKSLDYVDPDRIGYYGLSYGGRAAMYLPPLITDFKFGVSSASFRRFPESTLDLDDQGTGLYHERIGPFKFGLGPRFGRAELGQMVAPRGFMVENGYRDTAVVTEEAGHEFAKIQRTYDLLGISDRAKWGGHVGGHETHVDQLLPYIHRMLNHPVPPTGRVPSPE